jgi:anti-sigma factor (TIGR02949 family)
VSDVISCSNAVRQLWEYLDRGLSEDDHRVLERHLSFCVQCCGELEFARALQQLLRSAVPDVPEDVRARLDRFVHSLDTETGDVDGR